MVTLRSLWSLGSPLAQTDNRVYQDRLRSPKFLPLARTSDMPETLSEISSGIIYHTNIIKKNLLKKPGRYAKKLLPGTKVRVVTYENGFEEILT